MESSNSAILDLLSQYKEHVRQDGMKEEAYKWLLLERYRGRPDPSAPDFNAELRAIKFENLLYPISLGVLRHIAREKPQELASAFSNLYNEERPLLDRLTDYFRETKEIYAAVDPGKNSHQDERTASVLLAYHAPDRYPLYKDSFYSHFCGILGTKPRPAGNKYVHFVELLNDFVQNFVARDQDLIDLVRTNLPSNAYADPSHLLLAQDILYISSTKGIRYWLFQCNPDQYDLVAALNGGNVDSWTVTTHKESIRSGDRAIIWVTGEEAGCYALAEITEESHERPEAADDPFWKEAGEHSDWVVGIEVTHNLADRPVLWELLRQEAGFEDVPRGLRGTNFIAKPGMYEAIVRLLESERPPGRAYWLFAPGQGGRLWDQFFQKGVAAIDWPMGDLRQYPNRDAIRRQLQANQSTVSSKKNDTNACWEFTHVMRPGDVIIAKRGRAEFLGWGIVTSEYQFDPIAEQFPHTRKVDWVKQGPWRHTNIVLKTLTNITQYTDYVQTLSALMGIDEYLKSQPRNMSSTPLNTILYGPPGTGKTYHTISKALEIMGEDALSLNRRDQKVRFQKLQEAGRIAFVTFHQSMSYEDFVEGIKPVTDQSGSISYEIRPGIFKLQSIEAAFEHIEEAKSKDALQVLDFSNSYEILISRIEEVLSQDKTFALSTRSGATIQVVSISERGNLIIKHGTQGTREYIVSRDRLVKLDKAIPDLDKVENVMTAFREAIGGSNDTAFYAVLKEIRKIQKQSAKTDLKRTYTQQEKQEAVRALSVEDYAKGNPLPHLLIIDEINRGNVSQIFGELITLIEEDKRAGNDEALTVTLPYSKETFSVPKNLYIIGTMNTADRSVEALDTALRRRFEFVEMPPQPEKLRENPEDPNSNLLTVKGIILRDLLQTLNTRIEKLLDRDHCIGHAYFMKVRDIEELKDAFKHKIIPLLQEYFYGDYGKIGLVLGKGFVTLANSGKENADKLFADFTNHHRHELAQREVYHLKDVGKLSEEEFLKALESMNIKQNPAE